MRKALCVEGVLLPISSQDLQMLCSHLKILIGKLRLDKGHSLFLASVHLLLQGVTTQERTNLS